MLGSRGYRHKKRNKHKFLGNVDLKPSSLPNVIFRKRDRYRGTLKDVRNTKFIGVSLKISFWQRKTKNSGHIFPPMIINKVLRWKRKGYENNFAKKRIIGPYY